MSNEQDNPFADFEIISCYTTDDAIEDGTLIHFEPFSRGEFTSRKCCATIGVWSDIEDKANRENETRTPEQILYNLMNDAAMIVMSKKTEILAGEMLLTDGLEGNVTGKTLWIGINETGGFTVMFPSER